MDAQRQRTVDVYSVWITQALTEPLGFVTACRTIARRQRDREALRRMLLEALAAVDEEAQNDDVPPGLGPGGMAG